MGVDPDQGRATGTAEDPLHVKRDDVEVPLSLLIRLVGLTFLGYVVMTLLVGGYLWTRQNDARFDSQKELAAQLAKQNEILTRRLNAARVRQDTKIRTTVSELCVNAELRDTVIANQSKAIVSLLQAIPAPIPPKVQALIDVSQDGIETLEPKNEKDCPLPPGSP